MSELMKQLKDLFAKERIRLEEMVHFPLSGNGSDVRASDRLQELLVYAEPEWLPDEIKAVFGDDLDALDLWDIDDVCDRLIEAGIDGWLVQLSTPVRNRPIPTWGMYSIRWFYCPDLSELPAKAIAWIEELKAKWAKETSHG